MEKRGGEKASRSLLLDERVKTSARSWLTAQKVGEVTPRKFQQALNQEILPTLSIVLKQSLCERTARRWILRLGWCLKTLKKGVYMDGHEREDVVKYRNEVFLPAMAKFEERMTKFEGPELGKVEPTLREGEKEIIPQFHDESCLSVNDFKTNAWLGPGQTILQKKGRGRLIHVSEFINPITGRLVLHDAQGNIVDEARKIIYPGSNGDAWWDTEQLLAQVKHAIEVFEKAHPNCIALFIFDQSSAHASLGPDALKAFEMNKSDGRKQRIQHDTVIPESNPVVEHRGKIQKMTLPGPDNSLRPKGLESVLTERGFYVHKMRAKCSPVCPFENADCCMARLLSKQDDFANQESMLEILIKKAGHECIFLPKFHCELNPIEMVSYIFLRNKLILVSTSLKYWGWVKYRYRELPKQTFAKAKEIALQYLNVCPTNVIRQFINRSWRFMSTYRKGLTGNAAAWAVRKQKQHRQVSDTAMMSIDAVLNPI